MQIKRTPWSLNAAFNYLLTVEVARMPRSGIQGFAAMSPPDIGAGNLHNDTRRPRAAILGERKLMLLWTAYRPTINLSIRLLGTTDQS